MAVTIRKRSADSILGWGAGVLGSSTTTRYLYPWYDDRLAEVAESGIHIGGPGRIRNLRVRHNIPAGNGGTITYVIRVSGVDSGVKVDLASDAVVGNDIVNSVGVLPGDYVSIKVTKATPVGASPRNVAVTAELV
jgi:hypothetical protein